MSPDMTGMFAAIPRISRAIRNAASGKMVLFSLAAFIVSTLLLMGKPLGIARLEEITGGAGILDNRFFYSPEEAYAMLAALGDAGRAFDLTHIVPLDFIFPVTYTLFFVLVISWVLGRWLPADHRLHAINLVPLLWGGMDYLENLGIIAMLISWPAELFLLAGITGIVSLLKVVFCVASFLVLAGAFTGWLLSTLAHGSRSPAA